MTRNQIGWLFLLVVALLAYTGQLPINQAPSPPTSVIIASATATVEQSTESILASADGPGNLPINEKWAVQGDVWLTPTPGPVATVDPQLIHVAEQSEAYSDIPNSSTLPASEWQLWPCEAKGDWPEAQARWCPLVTHFAKQSINGYVDINIDAWLGYMRVENVTSEPSRQNVTAGATGICQIMPGDDPRSLAITNPVTGKRFFEGRPTVSQLSDPVFNIAYCARLLGSKISYVGSEKEGFKNMGHIFADDPYKETRMIRNNVIDFAGYDPWP